MLYTNLTQRFNLGEVSPLVQSRTDLGKYPAGLKRLENFIPLLQGPVRRRGGTRFVAQTGNGGRPVALLRFAFSETTTYIIEAGDGYLRFFHQGAPLMDNGLVYQIASPWSQADLFLDSGVCTLKYVQSGDVMYVVCPGQPPQKIMRFGHTDWRVEPLGGWSDRPNAAAVSLFRERLCLGAGQTVYMSQSGAFEYFEMPAAGMAEVRLFFNMGCAFDAQTATLAEYGTAQTVVTFLPNEAEFEIISPYNIVVRAKDKKAGLSRVGVRSNHERCSINSVSGRIAFRHASDGATFRDYVVISTDPARASIGIDPAEESVRALLITKSSIPVAADEPVEINVYSEQMDKIEWLCPAGNLLVGTSGGEFTIGETTTAEPLGPANVKVSPATSYGSSPIQPLRVGSVLVFAQRAGRKIREFVYDYAGDNYQATDLTVASEHLTKGGVTGMVWQSEPIETLWATRSDGQLLGFTYCREQDMSAWHHHRLGGGGRVSQIAVIPALHGGRDELWLSVAREVAGQTVYYLEVMERGYEDDENQAEAFYVDCGLTVRTDEPMTVVNDIFHLEGLEVAVLADGGLQPNQTVRQGRIELQFPAKVVQLGLPYDSVLTTLNFEMMLQDGTAQGRKKRIVRLILRLLNSLGGAAGPDANHLQELEFRHGRDLLDKPPDLFSGDKELSWSGGWETNGALTVVQSHPLPFTIAAMTAEYSIDGRN